MHYPASITEGVDTSSDSDEKVLRIGCCQRPPTKDHQEHICSQKVALSGLLQQGERHPRGATRVGLGWESFSENLGLTGMILQRH